MGELSPARGSILFPCPLAVYAIYAAVALRLPTVTAGGKKPRE